MQIEPLQFVSQITARTGPGGDHSRYRGQSADAALLQSDTRGTGALPQSVLLEDITAVQQARQALLDGTLETESAFNSAAETLLRLGI